MNLLSNRHLQVLYLVILTMISVGGTVSAQSPKHQMFIGKIINGTSKVPVTYGMIINTASKESAFSDSLGYFSIRVSWGDTIVISRIGYFQKEIFMNEFKIDLKKLNTIELTERSYELGAVNINSLGTYEAFRYKVVNAEIPEDAHQINPAITSSFPKKVVVLKPQMSIPLGSPVTAIYMLASKEGKSLRKLEKEIEKENIVDTYKHKYSPEIVSQHTGLKDLELEKFMKYCNPSVSFLQNAIEYEIVAKIIECFKSYKAQSEKKEISAP